MYDSIGRLIRSKQPEQDVNTALNLADPVTGNSGWADSFTYDANGNILTTTNAKGISITATYDNFNRIKPRNYSDSTPDVTFYYDGRGIGAIPAYSKGKTTKVTSSVSTNEYRTFDNLGRLLTHRQITNGNTYDTAYTYNLSGDLIEETYPSGRKVKNILDTNGDLSLVQTKTATGAYQNRASNVSYLAHGGVASVKLGNNKWESFQYNNRQQITRVGLGTSATNTSLLKIDYNYGTSTTNNGSLKQQKISYTGYSGEIVQNYTYDNLNRIQSATETFGSGTQSWKEDFIYDRFGNRRFGTGTTTITGCAIANCNPTISQTNNRFTNGQGYLYDKAGNVTQDAGGQRFEFDAENHQTKFFKHTNATTTPDATYHYDGDGKRVRKISGGKETIFVYNAGGSLIAEYETNITPVAANTKYLTQDHLGSPRIITSQTGAVISRHDYRAYGEEVYSGTANRTNTQGYGKADGIRKQYTGYERDYESGLDFAQARYYNSKLGRFTSVDPLIASASITNPQTFNRYSYVINSPYKFTDPMGLLPYFSKGQTPFSKDENKHNWNSGMFFDGLNLVWSEWVVHTDSDGTTRPVWVDPKKYKKNPSKYTLWTEMEYSSEEGRVILDPLGPNPENPSGWTLDGVSVSSNSGTEIVQPSGVGNLEPSPMALLRQDNPLAQILTVRPLSVYEEARALRSRAHLLFPDSANRDAKRHQFASRQLALSRGETTARVFGFLNEVQGLIMHDFYNPNLRNRLLGGRWAFQISDLSNNEIGFREAREIINRKKRRH